MEPSAAAAAGGGGGGPRSKLSTSRRIVPMLDEVLYLLICVYFFFTSSISTAQTVRQLVRRSSDTSASCFNFTHGNTAIKEFYSPNWPDFYPNNADCVRKIIAPKGQIIRVDFRELFEMEDDPKCENDFILVRDGQETYSRQLARVCGNQFPLQITSKGSYMWLMFKSDQNLQYRGFRAVYTFLKDQSYTHLSQCKYNISGPEAVILTDNITDQYIEEAKRNEVALDCSWRVLVPPGRQIQVSFTKFNLDKPNECELNFVEILYGPELNLVRKAHFCSSKADLVKLPHSQDVTFRFFAAATTLKNLGKAKMSVMAVITQLRELQDEETCTKEEFACDSYCISELLVCNGYKNCDKEQDEENCEDKTANEKSKLLTKANVVIMVIGAALLLGLCFSVCWNCVRKLREDLREKEEYVRQSREDNLDDLDAGTRSRTTLADGGCYVPGPDYRPTRTPAAAVPRENRNGGVPLRAGAAAAAAAARRPGEIREDTIDLDVETTDRSCQTPAKRRNSQDSNDNGSDASTPPPTPPPPPIAPPPGQTAAAAYRHRRQMAAAPPLLPSLPPPPPAPGFGSRGGGHRQSRPHFGSDDDGDDDDDDDAEESFLRHHNRPAGNETPRSYRSEAVIEMTPRPGSLHSAKSAPDVIVKL